MLEFCPFQQPTINNHNFYIRALIELILDLLQSWFQAPQLFSRWYFLIQSLSVSNVPWSIVHDIHLVLHCPTHLLKLSYLSLSNSDRGNFWFVGKLVPNHDFPLIILSNPSFICLIFGLEICPFQQTNLILNYFRHWLYHVMHACYLLHVSQVDIVCAYIRIFFVIGGFT